MSSADCTQSGVGALQAVSICKRARLGCSNRSLEQLRCYTFVTSTYSSASGMPSRLHEDLLRLFQNRPALAAELARQALQAELPQYSEARVDSSNLSDLRPAELRADLVVVLMQEAPVHGIVVEVQLARDADKEYVWPRTSATSETASGHPYVCS